MKKLKKNTLTPANGKASVVRMPTAVPPAPKLTRSEILPRKDRTSEELYRQYFVATPSPQWKTDDDHFSLEQPSPLKWVPSETTYGIGQFQ